jgi:3-oxoacyl-[acyl-carrier protein] reductase
MGKLNGKVAVITGAGRMNGLGRSYALALAKEGCSVVINDIDRGADKVAEEIKKSGGRAASFIFTICTKDIAEKLVKTAINAFGRVDILINNAGIVSIAGLLELEEKHWDDVFNVHVRGVVFCTQAAVKWMIDNKVRGKIIYITSPAGLYGVDAGVSYCAAKSALVGLTKSNAIELARYGICVNAVAPKAHTMDTGDFQGKMKDVITELEKKASINVLQRFGVPDDVAPLIVFLSCEDSRYVTGQIICATGDTGIA